MAKNVRTVNMDSELRPVAGVCGSLTVGDTVAQLTSAEIPTTSTHVFWSVGTAAIRVTFNDEDADTSVGHLMPVGTHGTWSRVQALKAKMHRATGSDGALYYSGMQQ